jgi:ketosteroid isomerase-like protein
MVDDNLQIYRRVLEAFNREGVEGVIEYFSEEIEIYDPDLLGNRVHRGHQGLRHVIAQLMSGFERVEIRAFERVEIRAFELIPMGDRVVALLHSRARGPRREVEMEVRDAHTVTFREGKIVYWRLYLDANEALADVGLGPRPPLDAGGAPAL